MHFSCCLSFVLSFFLALVVGTARADESALEGGGGQMELSSEEDPNLSLEGSSREKRQDPFYEIESVSDSMAKVLKVPLKRIPAESR